MTAANRDLSLLCATAHLLLFFEFESGIIVIVDIKFEEWDQSLETQTAHRTVEGNYMNSAMSF